MSSVSFIRPAWARGEPQSPTAAEEQADAQDDRAAAQRSAALLRARQAIEAAQLVVNEVHRTHGINLVDAQDYLIYARDAVTSEEEA
jgi:hypothetical protein